jgi:hypothetical protein
VLFHQEVISSNTVTAEFGPPPPAAFSEFYPWPTLISKTFTLLIF